MLKSADAAIHDNLTLDSDTSALARLKRELVTILDAQSKTNREFQEEVKVAIATITAKKQADQQTTRHGLVFEQAATFLQTLPAVERYGRVHRQLHRPDQELQKG
jgi:hypothetical protein